MKRLAFVLFVFVLASSHVWADSTFCPLTGIKYAAVTVDISTMSPIPDSTQDNIAAELESRLKQMGIQIVEPNAKTCQCVVSVYLSTLSMATVGLPNFYNYDMQLSIVEKLYSKRLSKTVAATIWNQSSLSGAASDKLQDRIKVSEDQMLDVLASDYGKDNPKVGG